MQGLPAELRDKLLARSTRKKFAKGQLIQQQGDQAHEYWYVEHGTIQIGRFAADGRLNLFAVLGAGESFGELAFIGEFPRTVDAIAGSDAELIRIGEAEFQNLIQSEPTAVRILLQTMALTIQESFDLIEASRNLSTDERLVQALLRLCGAETAKVVVSISQQELADLVGVSRVSLGKALKRLEKRGLLSCGYNRISISNSNALAAI